MSSTPSDIIDSSQAANDHIADDLACAECGYNLRTLAYNANCPECGMSVVISTRGDRLSAAPSDWLDVLFHGAWWLRASVMLAFPVVYLGVALSCYGIWVMTIAQPGRVEPSLDRGYRLAARWATIVGSLALIAMMIGALIYVAATDQRLAGNWTMQMKPGLGGGLVGELPMFDMALLIGHAVYVLGLLSTWRYLGVLAERVPDKELAGAWRKLVRCWIGSVLGLAGISGLANVLVRTGMVPGGSTSFWLPLILGLIFAVALLALWVVTLRLSGWQVQVLKGERLKAG